MKTPLYIFAGFFAEALNYAMDHGLDPKDFIYVVSADVLRSLPNNSGRRYIVIGTFDQRSDATRILAEAQMRGMVEEPA